eukprot:m.173391 g.173391  ORF g.173391 m.173391 type:complete len:327 (+) comp13689_c0_seq1:629-1609(+)
MTRRGHASMMQCALGTLTAVTALLSTPTAADFGCYEWPSVEEPAQTVHFLVSDSCSADLADLVRADAMSHLARANLTDVGCTNSAGMLYWGEELCNATHAALVEAFPDESVLDTLACDGGYLVMTNNASCSPVAGLLGVVTGRVSTTTARAPITTTESMLEQEMDRVSGFFSGRTPQWYALFATACVVAVALMATVIVVTAKSVRRLHLNRSAGGLHIGKRQVKVKQGVYSGIDELGFTANEIRIMDPGETKSARKTRGFSMSSTEEASPTASKIRYHHPDWCASTPASPQSQAPKGGKKVLRISSRRRLSESQPAVESDADLLPY